MSVKDALTRLVKIATNVDLIANTMHAAGFPETPYSQILGEVADAVYELLDEKTFCFDQSVTYYALFCCEGNVEYKTDLLMREYERNKGTPCLT